MKRVSFKVAKALKTAGYPIEIKTIEEAEVLGWNGKAFFTGMGTCGLCPYALEVWLWLWREKGIIIKITQCTSYVSIGNKFFSGVPKKDPEEAIIAAIDYLVDNKLLK